MGIVLGTRGSGFEVRTRGIHKRRFELEVRPYVLISAEPKLSGGPLKNSPIYYSSAEKTSKGLILDFFWMALDNSTDN